MLGSSRAASEALSNRLAALYEDPTSAPLLGAVAAEAVATWLKRR